MNVAGAALAALSYTKTVQVNAMTACFQIAERSLVLCKDSASERNDSLLSDCWTLPCLMQRQCKWTQWQLAFILLNAALSYAKIVQTSGKRNKKRHFLRSRLMWRMSD